MAHDHDFLFILCWVKVKILAITFCLHGVLRTSSPAIQSYMALMAELLALFNQQVWYQTFDGSMFKAA